MPELTLDEQLQVKQIATRLQRRYEGQLNLETIERFIQDTIVTDEDEWEEYIREARQHPSEDDLQQARGFARGVLARF